jgi:WD40 repeat protein
MFPITILSIFSCNSSLQSSVFSSPKTLFLQSASFGDVQKIVVSPDGKILIPITYDQALGLWDKQTGKKLSDPSFREYKHPITAAAFSENVNQLLSGNFNTDGNPNNSIVLWNLQNKTVKHVFTGHQYTITDIVFSPNQNAFASSGTDKTVKLWNQQTRQLQHTFSTLHEVRSVRFSADGSIVNAADIEGTIYRWNIKTGLRLQMLINPKNKILTPGTFYPVVFSSDGKLAARGDEDRSISLWDLETGQLIRTFTGHHGQAFALALSPNGQMLATAGQSGQKELLTGGNFHDLRLWNIQTGALLQQSSGHETITALAFTPDGKEIITGGSGDELKIWIPIF